MSLTTVVVLTAVLDLGVIAAVAAVMSLPFILDRGSEPAPVQELEMQAPLELAA
jgi:hypothetical protein